MPLKVEASFLSSLFNSSAHAETNTNSTPLSNTNSQNIALLEANVSSASDSKDLEGKKVSYTAGENENSTIVSENAMLPATGPSGVSDGKDYADLSSLDTSVYVVRKGDSITKIADMFDVSVNTILWANDMKKGDKLVEGDVLLILPTSGVNHIVTKGQTLNTIAKLYKVDVSDIASFNGISEDEKLAVGDEIIVPGGEAYIENTPSSSSKTTSKQKNTNTSLKAIAGYFINPVLGAIRTQGLHGKNAVDLAISIGTPIRAAAAGEVLLARTGWNGAYGNMVIIQHPNGTKTLYSHLLKLGTSTGESVSQGEIIGYVGNSGRVRAAKGGNGAHLHFEVSGAKNPGGTSPMSFATQ